MQTTTPAYSYSLMHYAGRNILCITDEFDEENPTTTVTNAAESVLGDIAKDIGQLPELVIYRDTDGRWDRLVVSPKGTFKGYSPIVVGLKETITDMEIAVQLAVTNTANPRKGVF